MIAGETREQLAQRILDADDWGHCLDCGEPVDAMAGEVQCKPCDQLAAELDAEREVELAPVIARIIAESERAGPWGRVQGELAL